MNEFIKVELNIPDNPGGCWDIFLNALKLSFDSFVMYQDQEFYFKEGINQEDIQVWIDSYQCSEGEDLVYNTATNVDLNALVRTIDPTIYENMDQDTLWVNKRTGDIFTCINNTIDANIWVGTKSGKLIRPIPPADKVDFFSDGSTVGFYPLYTDASDMTGRYPGKAQNIVWEPLFDKFVASSTKNGTIKIKKLPFGKNTETVTVASWVFWDGSNSVMPYGWDKYDLYCSDGKLGFNTASGDIHGINFTQYKNQWVYMVTTFKKGELGNIYINGVEQTLNVSVGSFTAGTATMDSTFTIFGWRAGSSYRRFGLVGRLRLFNRELTPQEVGQLTIAEVEFIKSVGGNI